VQAGLKIVRFTHIKTNMFLDGPSIAPLYFGQSQGQGQRSRSKNRKCRNRFNRNSARKWSDLLQIQITVYQFRGRMFLLCLTLQILLFRAVSFTTDPDPWPAMWLNRRCYCRLA